MTVEPIKDKKKINVFLTYLKGKSGRDFLLAKFQLNTGLRISDVVGVRVRDIFTDRLNFKDYFILRERKTGKEKKIKLNQEIKKVLKPYVKNEKLSNDDFLFQSKKGENQAISVTQAYRVLKEAANATGIENFGTHSLRKSWGFWTYKASRYNIGLIMDVFNHSSQKITLRYIGVDQESKDELYSLVQF
ncbi:tyrosine-type recombinase/integrase [Bacillus sp. EB106-08-02-XG196]|uniref:tyrosine-type recombinase/integrase n=1 Tax=Bacillus sp. EB106-08-02-XG196 TaxID=2737049 RepID=UPI0015C43196|nr:tyrosine-type recombinase/integrase [Bacillus sp. EB106-08-02-XG196]